MNREGKENPTLDKWAFPLTAIGMLAFGAITLGLGLATHAPADEEATEAYMLYQLEEFKVPLKPTANAKTLEMAIELEIKESHVDQLHSPGVMAALRSGIIAYTEDFKPDQLDEESERLAFEAGLLERINGIVTYSGIDRVALTKFTL